MVARRNNSKTRSSIFYPRQGFPTNDLKRPACCFYHCNLYCNSRTSIWRRHPHFQFLFLSKKSDLTLLAIERLRVQTLFFDAGYTREQICLQTGYTYDQVTYAISHRLTPQKSKSGAKVFLNTPQRKRLIQWATASQDNRETPWIEIPANPWF